MLYRADTRPVVTGHRSHQDFIGSARYRKSAWGGGVPWHGRGGRRRRMKREARGDKHSGWCRCGRSLSPLETGQCQVLDRHPSGGRTRPGRRGGGGGGGGRGREGCRKRRGDREPSPLVLISRESQIRTTSRGWGGISAVTPQGEGKRGRPSYRSTSRGTAPRWVGGGQMSGRSPGRYEIYINWGRARDGLLGKAPR